MENDLKRLLEFLAIHGGKIISSNDLHHELIAQARASNRMYVDENSLGYVWEPAFAGRFPMTEEEVKMFEWCYPIEPVMPKDIDVESILKRCGGKTSIETAKNAPLVDVSKSEDSAEVTLTAFNEWLDGYHTTFKIPERILKDYIKYGG